MGKGFKHGSSGLPLNFKIVGGTAAPSSPKENMIWVHTDAAITGYTFKATQPEEAEGRVWIRTGEKSTEAFEAIEKNAIWVYPLSAVQYIGGVWEDKTAQIYRNGSYIALENALNLFLNGDQCTAVTGGWKLHNNAEFKNGLLDIISAYTNGGAQVSTGKAIDLSAYRTLHVQVEESYTESYICILSGVPDGESYNPNVDNAVAKTRITTAVGEYTVDVSALDNSYFVWIGNWGSTGPYNAGCSVSRVWLSM